jgi:sugar transferase EpsL
VYRRLIKRPLDVVAALALLAILFPLMIAVAVAVLIKLGRPIMFRQQRGGLNGTTFTVFKFRTMAGGVGADGRTLTDAERLTSFGRALRSTSLDELPSLWNILRGDMSLVGPRPLLADYLPLYSPRQARRHEVRPGLTGWSQVKGRNRLSWQERFDLDVWYVENVSLLLDLRILTLTVSYVLQRRDISANGETTMSRFTGA